MVIFNNIHNQKDNATKLNCDICFGLQNGGSWKKKFAIDSETYEFSSIFCCQKTKGMKKFYPKFI